MSDTLLQPAEFIDSWYNVMSGVGLKRRDRRVSTSYSMGTIIDDATLSDIYRSEGLGTNVIDIPIGDMLSKWFYIEGDTDNIIVNALNDIYAEKYLSEALKWGDLFGGSVLFMGINDGQKADAPLNENQIQGIDFFEVYDKRDISWNSEDLYKEQDKPKFGQPQFYNIQNIATGIPFRVHESRCLIFDGKPIPKRERQQNRGWGDSRLLPGYERLKNFGESLGSAELITTKFIVAVLKMTNLSALLSNEEGKKNLKDRIEVMQLVESVLNTTIIDKNEELERMSSFGVSGLRELLDLFVDIICGEYKIPRVKLIGDQTKGLGSEATGNMSFYYDEIKTRQRFDLLPQLKRLCYYVSKSKMVKYSSDPKKLNIIFNELWQQSEKEKAETFLINSKSDDVYMSNGLPPEYVFLSRFGGQSYGKNLILPKDYTNMIKKMSVEEAVRREDEVNNPKKKPNDDKVEE